jgi:hypothetical protein
MKKRNLFNSFETVRDDIFSFTVYTIAVTALFMIGGVCLRAHPIMKFIGLILMVGSVYGFLYYPTIINNLNKKDEGNL